jgi:uncharacterized membrane protein
MIDPYFLTKWVHIVSATILFGTGLGTALHMWLAHLRGGPAARAVMYRNVVLADWTFTAPSGVVQVLSGIALIHLAGWGWFEPWLVVSYVLYVVAFACWVPVVWIQIRVAGMAAQAAAAGAESIPPPYETLIRWWFWLGWPAFLGLLGVYWLMISKPPLW